MANERTRSPRASTAMWAIHRGEVQVWLFRHRRQILAAIKKDGRVLAWVHFIELMKVDGVTRPSGKPLTESSVA